MELTYIKNINKLNLATNKNITNLGLKYITKIHTLILSSNKNITDIGLKYISNIHALDLNSNTNITDIGFKLLINPVIFKSFYIKYTNFLKILYEENTCIYQMLV